MRHAQALGILQKIDGYDGGAKAAFVWRKAWLARRDLLTGAVMGMKSPLREIPGLRYPRLIGLLVSAWREEPVEIATGAEAIQVGKTGDRLRSFSSREGTTLKVVREDSHYGAATRRELGLRLGPVAGSGLLVPRLDTCESRDGFLFVREQLLRGRAYRRQRDRRLFCPQVVRPLAAFYEHAGITMIPLSEALGPMTAFAMRERQEGALPLRLAALLEENPQVAVSLCHNDVLPSNLAVTREGVYFMDWGSAIFSLCGRDFVRLGRYYLGDPAVRECLESQITRLQRSRLGLEDMLLIQDLWLRYCRHVGSYRADTGASMPGTTLTEYAPLLHSGRNPNIPEA